MKRLLLLSIPLLLAAGCATSSAPLRQNTASYDGEATPTSSPAAMVPIGATPEDVKAQLGEPAHIRAKASGRFLRTTWSYENQGSPGHTVHVTFQRGQVESVRHETNPPAPAAPAQP